MADGGEVRIFVDDRGVEGHPGMLVKVAANHFAVLGPLVIGVQCGVNAHKALPVILDER